MGALTPSQLSAVAQWRASLGPDSADTSAATLARYARSTGPMTTTPFCVLRPRSRDAVVTMVRIAASNRVPLHPISRGKNWGYGDACAPSDGMALLDLSGLNRVLEVNRELGYAVIEPGVTQQQLYDAVAQDAPGYWIDATGAGPDASIVGNALQRGFGHTPYADHVRSICGMEVVLADARILNTGFGRFENARAERCFPYGLGPLLDGLFTQSNYGIVTKMGVWLYPKPEAFRFFWIKVDDAARLPRLVDALRPLRLSGVLRSAVHIGNDLRVVSAERSYPWNEAGGRLPLPPELRSMVRKSAGCGAWNAGGALVGTPEEVRGAERRLRKAARGLGTVMVLTEGRVALLNGIGRFLRRVNKFRWIQRAIDSIDHNFGLLMGKPTSAPLQGMLWRVREPWRGDVTELLETHAGLLWVAPVLPMRGEDAERILGIAEPILAEHAFDLLATFTLLNERAMVCILSVSYDKRHAEEARAAQVCHDALQDAFAAAGYYPYRESSQGHARWHGGGGAFCEVTAAIKGALDPAGIISPGLYVRGG